MDICECAGIVMEFEGKMMELRGNVRGIEKEFQMSCEAFLRKI